MLGRSDGGSSRRNRARRRGRAGSVETAAFAQHGNLDRQLPAPAARAGIAGAGACNVLFRRPLRTDVARRGRGHAARTRGPLVPRLPRPGRQAPRCRWPTAAAQLLLSRRRVRAGIPRQAVRAVFRRLWRDRGAPAPRQRYRGQLQGGHVALLPRAARTAWRAAARSGHRRAALRLHPWQLVPGQLASGWPLVRPGQRTDPAARARLLRRLHPAVRTQRYPTRTIDSIYYATDDPNAPKSHNRASRCASGGRPAAT